MSVVLLCYTFIKLAVIVSIKPAVVSVIKSRGTKLSLAPDAPNCHPTQDTDICPQENDGLS